MSSVSLVDKVSDLVEPILNEFGMELVDLEYRREGRDWFLRLFIDKPGGVTLDDCADVSREVDTLLEVEGLITHAYRLEVSSPGLDRPLKRLADFERFAGQPVKLKSFELLDPDGRGHSRKTFSGVLLGVVEGRIRIEQQDRKGGVVEFSLDQIAKAHLDPQF